MPHSFPSVCVFCGARSGVRPAYAEAGRETGRMLAEAGWRLIYGAGDIGIMGIVATSAMAAGGQTFGVIPSHLLGREVGKRDLTTLVVTEDMHERKKVMFMNSDAVVVLPGGAGSLDELFEVVTWRQIGLHDRPVFLLNVEGYWNPLLALIDHVIAEGFAEPTLRDFLTVVDDVATLRARLAEVLPPGSTR